MGNDRLIRLIENQIDDLISEDVLLITEAGDGPEAGGSSELDSLSDISTDDSGDSGDSTDGQTDTEGGDGEDPGLTLDGGGAGENGDLGDDETSDDDEGDDLGDMGGGSSFGVGGGGGGGFDFGGGDKDDKDKSEKKDKEKEDKPKSPESMALPADPVQATIDVATSMLDQTSDDAVILNAVKASIQHNFENFDDATPVIEQLWDTENPVLKIVARKLLLFISGR